MALGTWQPIENFTEPVSALEVTELRALDTLWAEQRSELEQSEAIKRFREKLARSWAIETGVIERVYDLDRGITEQLIEHGLRADLVSRGDTDGDPDAVVAMIRDHREVIDGIFDFVASRRPLSTSYVKELHASLTRRQEHVEGIDQFGHSVRTAMRHGDYKSMPNNPTRPDGTQHEYTPPEHVAAEMDRLIEMHLQHTRDGVPPEVEAAFLHHRFAQIHPFQDGNGRVARALATLVLLRAGWFPLNIDRDRKAEYIETLEAADLGNLRYLSRLIGGLQRQALVQALGIGDQAQRELEGIDQVLRAARDKVMGPGASSREAAELEAAVTLANRLVEHGGRRLEDVERRVRRELTDYAPQLNVWTEVNRHGEERAKWHRAAIIQNARKLGYWANPNSYAAWLLLRLKDRSTNSQTDVIIALHGIGDRFRGLIAVTAFWEGYIFEDGSWQLSKRELLDDQLFQVNSRDDPIAAEERFDAWLEQQLTAGLAIWQRGLSAPS